MNNRQRIASIQNTEIALPEGYEIERLSYDRWELRFNGEFISTSSCRRYASNAAQRDLLARTPADETD